MRKRATMWSAAALGLALLAPGVMAELQPGSKVPDAVVTDLKGKSVHLAQLRGNSPAIVNFFATY